MKTDELLTLLAQADIAKKPYPLWSVLTVFLTFCTIVTFVILGIRSDVIMGMYPLGFWIKTVFLLSLSAITSFLVSEVAKPKIFITPRTLISGIIACLMALVIREWMMVDIATILDPAKTQSFITCISFVSIYGIIGVIILTSIFRRYAPLDTKQAATFIGLSAASTGAVGYSLHCAVDSPTFIAIAYGLPVIAITGLARHFVAPRLNW